MACLGFVCSTERTRETKVFVPLMVVICSVHITEEQKTKENPCLSGSIFLKYFLRGASIRDRDVV